MIKTIVTVLLSLAVGAACAVPPATPNSPESRQHFPPTMASRPLWDKPIEVHKSRESIETNVILVGSEKDLASLTDQEIARLRSEARTIIERNMMRMLILPKDSAIRNRDFVSPLNQAIQRNIISDVRFEPLIWGEAV